MGLKYEERAALADASREASKRSSLEALRAELLAFLSKDRDADPQGLDRWVMRLMGVWRVTWAETLLRLVSNHVPSETNVGRGRGGGITRDLRAASTGPQSVRAQL